MAKQEKLQLVSEEHYRRMFPAEEECLPRISERRVKFWQAVSHKNMGGQVFRSRDADELLSAATAHAAALAEVMVRWQKRRDQVMHSFVERASHITAQIHGKTVTFDSLEEKFDALVQFWHELREPGSSTDALHNPAYLQIIGMGEPAIPLLLREVHRQTGHWFSALSFITGADVSPDPTGAIPQLRKAWLQWGTENGHDAYYSERAVAERAPSASTRERMRLGK